MAAIPLNEALTLRLFTKIDHFHEVILHGNHTILLAILCSIVNQDSQSTPNSCREDGFDDVRHTWMESYRLSKFPDISE